MEFKKTYKSIDENIKHISKNNNFYMSTYILLQKKVSMCMHIHTEICHCIYKILRPEWPVVCNKRQKVLTELVMSMSRHR